MAPGFKYGGDDLSAPFARQRIFISTVEQRQESINKEKSRSGVWHKLTIKSRHVSFTIYNVVSDRAYQKFVVDDMKPVLLHFDRLSR